MQLHLVGAFSDKSAASLAAETHGGILLSANSSETAHLPFAALVLCTTDNLASLNDAADVGCYLVCERTIKHQPIGELNEDNKPGAVGIFTMVANPVMGAEASDSHWRDNHAPLALEVHVAMTHYYQLSILYCFSGPEWNGFALCCFASEDDLRNRFFDTPEGELAIAEDVARFADTRQSPRRVIATFS